MAKQNSVHKPEDHVAEASQLGWKPGEWPNYVELVYEGDKWWRYSLVLLQRDPDGDIVYALYREASGAKLTVFND